MKRKVVRISNEEFRKSRRGLLGRFPCEDLYQAEKFEKSELKQTQRLKKKTKVAK